MRQASVLVDVWFAELSLYQKAFGMFMVSSGDDDSGAREGICRVLNANPCEFDEKKCPVTVVAA